MLNKSHSNIVKLEGIAQDQDHDYLVFESLTNGSLQELIKAFQ